MDQRLIELESRIAFQDDTIQKLNDVLVTQQNQIDKLIIELESLNQQVRSLSPDLVADPGQETPPPHY